MLSRGARLIACALTATVALSVTPASAVTNKSRAITAAGYIARQQEDNGSIVSFSVYGSTADAIVALVAARRGRDEIVDALNFLRLRVRTGKLFKHPEFKVAGVLGKIVMAVEAAGQNARRFGGRNLVRRIVNLERPSGRLGRKTEVFSHGLLMLALEAAGRRVPGKVSRWLADAQCGDGGWAFDNPPGPNDDHTCLDTTDPNDFVTSDSNTTATAIMALETTSGIDTAEGFNYLDELRDPVEGGWGYTAAFPATDANSTSLVIQAHLAAGRAIASGVMAALKGLQVTLCGGIAGAFRFLYGDENPPDLGATVSATPALMKQSLPIEPFEVTKPVPPRQPCG